ncbi:MAG: hypothetical protein ACP5IB_06825 [Thermoplasmata archaeon]
MSMIEGKSQDEKLGPAGFGRFMHDLYEHAFFEIESRRNMESFFFPDIFFLYTILKAYIDSLIEEDPKNPYNQSLKKDIDSIDEKFGPLFKRENMRLENTEAMFILDIFSRILRRIGILKTGNSEEEDDLQCLKMEEDLKT